MFPVVKTSSRELLFRETAQLTGSHLGLTRKVRPLICIRYEPCVHATPLCVSKTFGDLEMFIMDFNAPENKDLGIRMLSIMLRK